MTGYRFCDDFDGQAGINPASWTAFTAGGDLSVDHGEATSRPGSLLSVVRPNPAVPSRQVHATIEREVVLTGSRAHVELDLRVDADVPNIQSLTYLTAIGLPSGDFGAVALLRGQVRLIVATASGGTTLSLPLDPFPAGAWTHLVAEITFDPRDGSVSLSSDGKVLVDSRHVSTSSAANATSFLVVVGANGVPEQEVHVHADNLAIQ